MKRKFHVEIDRTSTRTGWVCVELDCKVSDNLHVLHDRARREAYARAEKMDFSEHEEGTPTFKVINVAEVP